MSRIVTVYSGSLRPARQVEMGFIRWYRMSAALAALGHSVDIASAELRRRLFRTVETIAPNLRIVPLSRVRWRDYDVVKTLFHSGFETLERYGGAEHPFIIAKLGSVVGPTEMDGVFFYGKQREDMFRTQERIAGASRYVALLSKPAVDLWRSAHGAGGEVLLVPGAASTVIPPRKRSPYPPDERAPVVFSGNFYSGQRGSQPEAHRALVNKLNRLGAMLHERNAHLYVIGTGDRRSLDPRFVTYRGELPYEDSWDYLYFAAVGVVVTAGGRMHNNESTKIYHYLRAGLPVVTEAGFPNEHVVIESGLGHVVENGDLETMARRIDESVHAPWDRERAIRYILAEHTWEKRAEIYDRVLRVAT